eukprot:2768263-Pleurochrysis_carterae.AAC.3
MRTNRGRLNALCAPTARDTPPTHSPTAPSGCDCSCEEKRRLLSLKKGARQDALATPTANLLCTLLQLVDSQCQKGPKHCRCKCCEIRLVNAEQGRRKRRKGVGFHAERRLLRMRKTERQASPRKEDKVKHPATGLDGYVYWPWAMAVKCAALSAEAPVHKRVRLLFVGHNDKVGVEAAHQVNVFGAGAAGRRGRGNRNKPN